MNYLGPVGNSWNLVFPAKTSFRDSQLSDCHFTFFGSHSNSYLTLNKKPFAAVYNYIARTQGGGGQKRPKIAYSQSYVYARGWGSMNAKNFCTFCIHGPFHDDFRLALEAEKQSRLEADLAALRDQLENANEGLKAANRLGDQLDAKTR